MVPIGLNTMNALFARRCSAGALGHSECMCCTSPLAAHIEWATKWNTGISSSIETATQTISVRGLDGVAASDVDEVEHRQ
jgi:hypothetical protein